jgi:hypothetical protein
MNEQSYRNMQNLPKIGPVFSTKDEKQRMIVEEIMNFRIKPELKLKINMNIPGLDKKKTPSPFNPDTRRIFSALSSKGREGWIYIWTMTNISRFFIPFLGVVFYYYCGHTPVLMKYWETQNNREWETVYCKMQTIPGHYMDRLTLMA